MTADTVTHSRGPMRPRFAGYFRDLWKSEGAGNAGCALHPRSRAQWRCWLRARAYRAAENIRHSLRNGFTAYNALSPVIGFLATVTCRLLHKLDASAEASGPHVFAVRFSAVRRRQLPRPPQPTPRCDVGQRPSERDGIGENIALIYISEKAKYFLFRGLTFCFRKSELICPSRYFAAGATAIKRDWLQAGLVYRLDLGKDRAEAIHDGLCIGSRGGYLQFREV